MHDSMISSFRSDGCDAAGLLSVRTQSVCIVYCVVTAVVLHSTYTTGFEIKITFFLPLSIRCRNLTKKNEKERRKEIESGFWRIVSSLGGHRKSLINPNRMKNKTVLVTVTKSKSRIQFIEDERRGRRRDIPVSTYPVSVVVTVGGKSHLCGSNPLV